MSLTVASALPRDLLLGVVRVEGIAVGPAAPALADELTRWIDRRRTEALAPAAEARRRACREMLRHGRYKPTGRGKPASEYLLRAASEGTFPRISGPVDANNLVSLKHCLPISLWDLDRAGTDAWEFRLGREGEHYVFNPAGQTLELQDLVCGCALGPGGSSPVVTPVKDSLATKIQEGARRLAGAIYYPLSAGDEAHLHEVTDELLSWLRGCGEAVSGALALLAPGETVTL